MHDENVNILEQELIFNQLRSQTDDQNAMKLRLEASLLHIWRYLL